VRCQQASPAARVRAYYGQVRDNGTFYGLMPPAGAAPRRPARNVVGNDWPLAAAIPFQ
jgi:hypothetical protein